jgi:hypothetical protein
MLGTMRMRQIAAIAASVLLLASCSKGGPDPDAPPTAVPGRVSPLTGKPQETPPNNPAYLVKIENTAGGEPQYGLNKADFIIEELVEGGLTRLAAMFYSNLPTKVGHVRSMRTTDIGLSKPVSATVVASGAASDTYDQMKEAHVTAFTEDHGAPGFSSDPAKERPYNRMLNLSKLNESNHAVVPKGDYFKWGSGPATSDETKQTSSVEVQFSPGTSTGWSFSNGTWGRTNERAAAGEAYRADTLIVIFARVAEAGYNDAAGNPVPETVIEGSGRAVVFSGDSATEATWHKSNVDGTMSFTSKAGKAFGIKPGHVFLEAAPRGGDVTY